MTSSDPSIYLDYGPDLPDRYGINEIVALVRDPEWLFAYWEVVVDDAAEEFVTLCLHDETQGRPLMVPVHKRVGSWYLPVRSSGKYRLDVGLFQSGQFVPLAHSAKVRTPPARPGVFFGSSRISSSAPLR